MTSVHPAAQRRNDYPYSADQTLKPDDWSRPQFPAADLIERVSHRPRETCALLATVAGFRAVEAR